ncbi:Blasticidin-S deaminase [Rhypophila sp. PSN 637]
MTGKIDTISAADEALIALAISALSKIPASDENHTVAAACRSAKTGKTFVGVNVDHFTGGPCAELVVLGTAAANGVLASEIGTMVAVVRRTGKPITVINPCGRCRQVMMDYNSAIDVLVMDESQGRSVKGAVKKVKAKALLPFAYVWPDGNTGQSSAQTLEGGGGADDDGKDV